MAAQKQDTWVLDKWFAGVSADPFYGPAGSCYHTQNLDLTRYPKALMLAPTTTTLYDLTSGGEDVVKMITTRFGVDLAFTDNKVYSNGTLIKDLTGVEFGFYNAIEVGQYIFVIYLHETIPTNFIAANTAYGYSINLWKFRYYLIANQATIAGTDMTTTSNAFIRGTALDVRLHSYKDSQLLVSAGALLYSIADTMLNTNPTYVDGRGPFTAVGSTLYNPKVYFRNGSVVKGITEYLDQFKAYYNITGTNFNDKGMQSYCAILSTLTLQNGQIEQVLDLQDGFIKGVQNDNEKDYVFIGEPGNYTNTEIWICSGADQQVFTKERLDSFGSQEVYGDPKIRPYIMSKGYLLYATRERKFNQHNINLAGQYMNGYPLASYPFIRPGVTGQVNFIARRYDAFTYGIGKIIYQVSWVQNFNSFLPSYTYATTGTWYSLKYYNKVMSSLKAIDQMHIAYYLPAGATIKISCAINDGSFVDLLTMSGTLYEGKRWAQIPKNQLPQGISHEFNWIQIQFTLTVGTDTTISPLIYDYYMTFYDNLRGS